MDISISLIVGISQAIIFNPIDKAIYTSIITNTSIFNKSNWKKPFSGSTNNIYTRIITSGLYFYLIDYTKHLDTCQASLMISLTTSLILNPFNVIKYRSYGNNTSTYASLISTYNKYGMKFMKIGLASFIMRDFVFNLVYLNYKKSNNDLIYNCGVICTASIISSPFHFIRNMKYNNDESVYSIMKTFTNNFKTTDNKARYIIRQFGIGHGTLRTIAGVYAGQVMYSSLKEIIR
jgi:hypothetical protein